METDRPRRPSPLRPESMRTARTAGAARPGRSVRRRRSVPGRRYPARRARRSRPMARRRVKERAASAYPPRRRPRRRRFLPGAGRWASRKTWSTARPPACRPRSGAKSAAGFSTPGTGSSNRASIWNNRSATMRRPTTPALSPRPRAPTPSSPAIRNAPPSTARFWRAPNTGRTGPPGRRKTKPQRPSRLTATAT